MNKIKFSHKYAKMPENISDTRLLEVFKAHYKDLSPFFKVYDTDGYYELPKTDLLVLFLVSYEPNISGGLNEHPWTTVRSWTPEKEKYYKVMRGEHVEIVIEGNTP